MPRKPDRPTRSCTTPDPAPTEQRGEGRGERRPTCRPVLAILALLALAFAPAPAARAEGTATGALLNGVTGQPVRGATLEVEGTEASTTSDVDGLFRLTLEPGTYTLKVTKDGFEPQKVTGVTVTRGSVENVSLVLMPERRAGAAPEGTHGRAGNGSATGDAGDTRGTFAEAITVSEDAAASSESALLTERKRAAQISDSIGTEEIGKITGSDAAGILKRVTGISLQDDKYVYVRGLGDRYSQTTLNGSKLPSTEFERKVVPLDLFPTELLEKITVSKSYTVDKPGDFAAGLVELVTREFPPRQVISLGVGLGWNGEATGETLFEYADGVSFGGDGGQALPGSIPTDPLVPFSPILQKGFPRDELEELGEQLIGAWAPATDDDAPFETSFDVAYGNTFGRLGLLLSMTHENDFSTRFDEVQSFFVLGLDDQVRRTSNFIFDRSEESVRQAFNANLAYRVGTHHQLQLRSLQTTLATSEGRIQEGFLSDITADVQDFRGRFKEQEVFNSQLTGNHFLADAGQGAVLDWRLAYSDATTDEDLRQTLYEETFRDSGVFTLTDNAQSGFLFFNDLDDELLDTAVNWESFLTTDTVHGSLKGGLAFSDSERDFLGRRLRFRHRDVRDLDLSQPPEDLFIEELIGPNFELREVTRPTDTYSGTHQVSAAYLQADVAWQRWRWIGGVRVEDSDQQVVTLDRFTAGSPPLVSEVTDTDVLPSLSLVYQLRDNANLRFSTSRTVNRPEFRELAPFRFTNVAGGFAATGNPDLERALIRSFDARWEWFPSGGEVVAVSVFFKEFDDPIEAVQLAGAEPVETFQNVESAENVGFELELRRNLGTLTDKLEDFTMIVNYAFVESEVSIDPRSSVLTNENRPLVGQPDNVLNTILEWNRPETGTTLRLLANFVDDKVFRAAAFGLPDVLEEARTTVDVVWRQGLDSWVRGLGFKLSGTNLTDESREWTQGGQIYRFYEPGRSLGLSLSYKPF